MRIVVNEPLDPEGALFGWLAPDLRALGHEVLHCPVQELVPRLGVHAYQALLLDLARTYRPDLIVVHPPYDFLGAPTCAALRATGARIVALGFDDPVAAPLLQAPEGAPGLVDSLRERFDLYASTSPTWAAWLRAHGLRASVWLRWALSCPESPALGPQAAPASRPQLLLMGRPNERRLRLLRELADRHVRVDVWGHGWGDDGEPVPAGVRLHGPLAGAARAATLRSAPAVLCPAGWEGRDLRMVKARLLEVTMAGGLALAERCPDLEHYFSDDEVLPYSDVAEAARWAHALSTGATDGLSVARRAHRRSLSEHTWRQRFGELLAALDEHAAPTLEPRAEARPPLAAAELPASYAVAMSGLGLELERAGRWGAGARVFEELLALDGSDGSAHFALARCRYALGEPATAATALERASAVVADSVGADTARLPLQWPAAVGLTGLGRGALLSPQAEVLAYRLAALVDSGAVQQALDLLTEHPLLRDGDAVVAVASLLHPDAGGELARPVWAELGARLQAADPVLLSGLRAQVVARWGAAAEPAAGGRVDPNGGP